MEQLVDDPRPSVLANESFGSRLASIAVRVAQVHNQDCLR